MLSAISVLLLMARIVIKVHIKVILFLIKRFEITNGLIVALSAEAITLNLNLNIWIRVIAFILITVGCILLQYFFIPARIMFGAFSSILLSIESSSKITSLIYECINASLSIDFTFFGIVIDSVFN